MDFLISVVFVSFKSDKYFRFGLFLRRENFTDFTNSTNDYSDIRLKIKGMSEFKYCLNTVSLVMRMIGVFFYIKITSNVVISIKEISLRKMLTVASPYRL